METFTSNTKDPQHPVRRTLCWADVRIRANFIASAILKMFHNSTKKICIYGIPRGGIFVALLIDSMEESIFITDNPSDADVFVDDVIESGSTAHEWMEKYPKAQWFFALYDKRSEPDLGWLIFPWENATGESGPQDNIRRVLQYIGENPDREGLIETPDRVVRSWDKIFGGYNQDINTVLKVFEDDTSDEMVVLKDIEFYSTCEHHMLPFFGKAHIAYIPKGRVVGISKLARILEVYSRRLQIQERLCGQITKALMTCLEPLGAACLLEAQHFCMTSRGVEKQNSIMVTSSLEGVFKTEAGVREEFLSIIRR